MKQRNIALVILYGFITLGIYDLVWLYKTRNEMVARGANIPQFLFLMAPVIIFGATCAIGFITLMGSAGNFSDDYVPASFFVFMGVAILALLATLPITLYWMYKYSEAVEYITNKQTTLGVSFGLWILFQAIGFPFIWNGLIQDSFNKHTDTQPVEGQASRPASQPVSIRDQVTPPPVPSAIDDQDSSKPTAG